MQSPLYYISLDTIKCVTTCIYYINSILLYFLPFIHLLRFMNNPIDLTCECTVGHPAPSVNVSLGKTLNPISSGGKYIYSSAMLRYT